MSKKQNKTPKQLRIELICRKTGWGPSLAKEALAAASKLGITSKQYVKYECWSKDEEGMKAVLAEIVLQAKIKEERIQKIAELTGWTEEKVKDELAVALKSGISTIKYLNYECWNMTAEELILLGESIKKNKKRRNNNIKKISEKSGWDMDTVKEAVSAANRLGIPSSAYLKNECWLMSDSELASFAATRKNTDNKEDDDDQDENK